ncbi:MAG: sugar ABC transporter permease [Deltaproteobacteria bacterium]|nr:sugar ABC transporter permease [Deltaproteobacteria bacterium]
MQDKASPIQIFTRITLPLMQPYIVLVVILRLIHGLKVFDKIFVISDGGPVRASETLNLMVYNQAFQALNYGFQFEGGVRVSFAMMRPGRSRTARTS